MTLAAGTRLGPYEILAPLGAGGMGEVYRGTDTRLSRPVAIKVLPSHLSSNPDLRERFDREARAISSLNHAHICTLYDVGHQDGIDYLVMEYLEGELLDQRLSRGPLPTDQALRYGIEIAEALDKAHRHGIVHRDLKPGNVMLTKSGAKLLDFGLAKLRPPGTSPAVSTFTALPTQERPLTTEGSIVGTFQYMAPEQLEGKEPDARTDIFAFGAVLYEMATGRKAFTGKSQASLIAAILASEPPPMTSLQPLTPPVLERVVKTCLAKDPDERWQSAHDLVSELKWIREAGSQAGLAAPIAQRRRGRERMAWAMNAVTALLAILATLAVVNARREPPRRVTSSILPPEKASFDASVAPLAISPDGRRLALIVRAEDGRRSVWVRALESGSAQPLVGTDGASAPFWSPDGRFIGFFADGKLKKVDATGGPVETLADSSAARGGTWGPDGTILFTPSPRHPVHAVRATGGTAAAVTQLKTSPAEYSHRWPWFLPDGRHFLYVSTRGSGEPEGWAVSVGSLEKGKEPRPLLRASSNVVYSHPGYLLYLRQGILVAQPFDASRLEVTGDPVPIADQIQISQTINGNFAVSQNGLLAYHSGTAHAFSQLVWVDRTGKQIATAGPPSNDQSPRLSPDGRRGVSWRVGFGSGPGDLWIHDLSRGVSTRFTFEAGEDSNPVWSPDGSHVVFVSGRNASAGDLYQKAASGTGTEELLFSSPERKVPTDWSRDGRFIVFHNGTTSGPVLSWDLWVFSVADRKASPVLQTPFFESDGVFSPDGRWLAYLSDATGRPEVYVRTFPGEGGQWQISTGGAKAPTWAANGKELFYESANGNLMAVEVKTGNTFESGPPKPLFQARLRDLPSRQYDPSPDGTRFLMNVDPMPQTAMPVILVQNWSAGLSR